MAEKYKLVHIYAVWLLFWGVVIFGWLSWLGYKKAPLIFVEDSWSHEVQPPITSIDDNFRPTGWRVLPDSAFSPVKDEWKEQTEELLLSHSFVPITAKQAQVFSFGKVPQEANKKAYLFRGVYFALNSFGPNQGFGVYVSRKRVWVEQGGWGNLTQMKRKAVVIWLDFVPSEAYCTASETV